MHPDNTFITVCGGGGRMWSVVLLLGKVVECGGGEGGLELMTAGAHVQANLDMLFI